MKFAFLHLFADNSCKLCKNALFLKSIILNQPVIAQMLNLIRYNFGKMKDLKKKLAKST